ncbi:MAG TPA: YbaK/EbsC family protein, partial [bacterium]|nr:YbaK/EbsC family protein [bacterium]
SHNPFTGPKAELLDTLKSIDVTKLSEPSEVEKIESLTSTQYDLVCNGYEVGGGGIRVHDPEALERVFEIIGHSKQKIQEQFGHILEAFKLGAPPHGGFAFGIDRLVMLLTKDTNLKEIIPFPMTGSGKTAIMDAPSLIEESQLVELGLTLRGGKKANVYQDICSMLDGNAIKYDKFSHKEVLTSEEAAAVRGTDLASGAKALVIKADETFCMVVISAASKMDSKKLKTSLGVKKTRFATAEEVEKLTGCLPGAVPPFGNLLGLRVWVDRSIEKQKTINFNAGERTKSLQMQSADWFKVVPHTIIDISE